MSADGRKRIAEAQKARWAKQKKAARAILAEPVKKPVAKKVPMPPAPAA